MESQGMEIGGRMSDRGSGTRLAPDQSPFNSMTGRRRARALAGVLMISAMLLGVPQPAKAGGVLNLDYGDAEFTAPLVIDNKYWPLNPDGKERTFTYLAETADGCVVEQATVDGNGPYKTLTGEAPYTNDLAVEVEDIGYIDEECTGNPANWVKTEHTFDWYRQDDNENIWYVGELSLDYEADIGDVVYDPPCSDTSITPSLVDMADRPLCYAGSWEAGINPDPADEDSFVAEAGVVVPSNYPAGGDGPPLTSGTHYMQEFAVDAMDVAKVLKTNSKVKYKIDGMTNLFRHCRMTKEYSSLERGAVEQKNYCPEDGGLVVIKELSGGKTVLVVLDQIDPALP